METQNRLQRDVARQLQIKNVAALPLLCLIPADVRTPDGVDLSPNDPLLREIERHRTAFDAPVAPLVADLRAAAADLLDQIDERPKTAVADVHDFTLGEADSFYPATRHRQPWRRHRVAITRAKLDAADYTAHTALWTKGQSPYAHVAVGREARLGPLCWICDPRARPDLDAPRAAFLTRRADVLELWTEVQS